MLYGPGARFAAVYAPVSDVTTVVAWPVAVLVIVTVTPGSPALVESIIRPEIAPRSDCATPTAGYNRHRLAATQATARLIRICPPKRRIDGDSIGVHKEPQTR